MNRAEYEDLKSRAVGAYLGLSIGDALGATTEFMTPREIKHVHGVHRDLTGGGWLHLKPGQVTDDTTMSLALGRTILDAQGVEAVGVAESFDEWLRNKPVDVGATVRRGIVRFRTHGTVQGPIDEYDAGNGAVMRVLPIALCGLGADRETLSRAATLQAHVTHNAPLADAGMMTVVHMVQCALSSSTRAYQDMIAMAHDLGRAHSVYDFGKKQIYNPSGFLPDTLKAVFQSFCRTDNFEQALIDVVNRGGDADTTGAILGFIAGALYGQSQIPQRWLKVLDTSVRHDCEKQAVALLSLSPYISGQKLSIRA